jgi:osmoprotectant transport system permease protein
VGGPALAALFLYGLLPIVRNTHAGSATIAAFIGAGGFGEPISTELSLNDVPMILTGAIHAAGLALVVQGLFALLERAVVPRGLRRC